ncbi:hypothetical protein FO519_004489 [Halicephalobus sp. NKZ332]|nr:hypothetical protein FO519_004489 [Halicephalobus sp. NKZ332]
MTAEVDSETRKYLRELDSFGAPPDLYDIHSEAAVSVNSRPPVLISNDFRQKLHQINVNHQKKLSGESPNKSVAFSPEAPKTLRTEMLKYGEKAEIKKDESENLRQSVLKATRPLNPWAETQKLPSERSVRSPLNVQTQDQLSSGQSSLSPASPLSNSATSTSSNGSLGSASKWRPRIEGTFSAKLVNTEPEPKEKVIVRTYRPNSSASSSSSTITSTNGKTKDNVQLRSGSLFVDPSSLSGRKSGLGEKSPTTKEARETITKGLRFLDEVESENQKRIDDLTESLSRQKIGSPSRVVGTCGKCFESVFDNNQVTYALDSLFHDQCFSCFSCKKPLRGRKFYRHGDKNYCEEDYFLNGLSENSTICSNCERPITDMVLQALGKSFHPKCFRCHHCSQSLDGVPFAVDGDNKVFCMEDYQNIFSPNCAACHKPIKASNDYGQIVRVVAMEKEFHIDCYRCEGCGMQLTNEREKQCYPLNDHLLCRRCNLEWSTMGVPITDC